MCSRKTSCLRKNYFSLKFAPIFFLPAFLILSFSTKTPKLFQTNNNIKVVVIGSSTSYGMGASSLKKSWVGLLKKQSQDSIINLSVPGFRTYDVLPYNLPNYRNITPNQTHNIDTALKLSPNLIIFSLPSNDVGAGFSIQEYLNNMKTLTDICTVNKIEYLVTSTLPRTQYSSDKRKTLYNLKGLLERRYNKRYLEIYTPVADLKTLKMKANLCTKDSIHPNDFGHLFIYNNILPIYLETKKRISKQ